MALIVVAVEAIRNRNNAHACKAELCQHRQHEVVVRCETREIIDENDLELLALRGRNESTQSLPILARSRFCLIGVYVVFEDSESTFSR